MAQRIRNGATAQETEWECDGLKFRELIRQEYGGNGCVFSAGQVEGHPVDTLYLRWLKDDEDGGMLLLRPDEVAAIAWCCTGALWSVEVEEVPDLKGIE